LRTQPDCLTYQQLGGIACHLAYSFIAHPKTILAAFYQRFQALKFDSTADKIEDKLLYLLILQASEKDDLTWSEVRMSNEYGKFREAALKEIKSLGGKESWVVVKQSGIKGKNILPSKWALKRKRFLDGRI